MEVNFGMGEVSAFLGLIAYVIYIRSILKGVTRPSRATWWVLSVIGLIVFATAYDAEARQNFWLQLCYVFGPLAVAILSLFSKYGYREKLQPIDKTCLIGAFLCIIIWQVLKSPSVAFIFSIVVDFIGLIPTIYKAAKTRPEESLMAWIVTSVASILNMTAVNGWFKLSDLSWVYAGYLGLINLIITVLILRSNLRLKPLKIKIG